MWSCKQPKEMHILLSPKGVTSIHYRKAKAGNRSALSNFNQQQQLKMKLEYSRMYPISRNIITRIQNKHDS